MKNYRLVIATLVFVGILLALWVGARHSSIAMALGGYFPRAFAAFGLLLAPLWFGGFGALRVIGELSSPARIILSGSLAASYFVLTLGTPQFHGRNAIVLIAFPVLFAAFLQEANSAKLMSWRDGFALVLIVAAYYLKWFHGIWLNPEVLPFSKLFLADVSAYGFLVVRRIEGSGYSLVPTARSLTVGVREWLLYIPLALTLGLLSGFVHFPVVGASALDVAKAVVVTFLLIAIPEELFFRSILQNLLETRIGRARGLVVTALLFGLSHFNHGSAFNWRYVLLASIAGIFYGRAWRAERNLFAAVVTHTAVDVVWSLWFR